MQKHSIVLFAIVFSIQCFAQIDGPNSGATFTITAIPGSSNTWSNISNAGSSNNTYASFGNITGSVGRYTDYLVATNFGFNLPPGATITGIQAEVERADPNGRTADYSVRIVKNGTIGTTEQAFNASYSISDNIQTYGNGGDSWGESWTVADINSANFGIAIAAKRSVSGGSTAGRVDDIRIYVFYFIGSLPLKLVSFQATARMNTTHLNWTSSAESNMSHFEVERSVNGSQFHTIGTVPCLNNNLTNNYSYADGATEGSQVFYRLKMVDKDGPVTYSGILAVQSKQSSKYELYPSICNNNSRVYFKNQENNKLNIQFFSPAGILLGQTQTRSNSAEIVLTTAYKGLIIYRIEDASKQRIHSGKLMIQ